MERVLRVLCCIGKVRVGVWCCDGLVCCGVEGKYFEVVLL